MKWMDPAYWLAVADGLRTWLLGLEPSFFHANAVLRVFFIFIIVKIFFSLLVVVVKLTVHLMDKALSLVASTAARRLDWLIYDVVERVAPIYVRVQAVALRIMRPAIGTGVLGRNNEAAGDSGGIRVRILGRPWSIFRNGLLAYIVIFRTVRPPSAVFMAVFAFLRSLTRISILNIASAATALWLAGLLHLTEIGGNLRLGEIPLSTLVASGTLLALILVALNIDVRGKAELNKVASLTCRIALHRTTPKILRIADALGATRRLAVRELVLFPTESELFELTGREDLCWRGSRLLPLNASFSLISESASQLSITLTGLSEVLVDRPPRWPIDNTRSSIMRGEDTLDQDTTLMRESKAINDILIDLYESGLTGKLNKVLSLPARYFLVDLSRKRFGLGTADAIHLKSGKHWYDYALDEDSSIELQNRWKELANADPNDPLLREECVILNRLVRSTVYNLRSGYWRIAVDEYRLLYLAEAIDSSLRPRLHDRIRQLFDK